MSATGPAQLTDFLDVLGAVAGDTRRPYVVTADSARSFGLPGAWGGHDPLAHTDVGIREALAISLASGLAREGFDPFVATFATFGLRRGWEALSLVDREDHPVVVLAGMSGLSAAEDGATHHCLDDLAALATMPRFRVYCPSDRASVQWTVADLLSRRGPAWVRLVREPVAAMRGTIVDGVRVARPGNESFAVVGYGPALSAAASRLPDDVAVVDLTRVQPLPVEALAEALADFTDLLVLEEHRPQGGLGDRLRAAPALGHCHIEVIGIEGEPGSGGYADLLDRAGLGSRAVLAHARHNTTSGGTP